MFSVYFFLKTYLFNNWPLKCKAGWSKWNELYCWRVLWGAAWNDKEKQSLVYLPETHIIEFLSAARSTLCHFQVALGITMYSMVRTCKKMKPYSSFFSIYILGAAQNIVAILILKTRSRNAGLRFISPSSSFPNYFQSRLVLLLHFINSSVR